MDNKIGYIYIREHPSYDEHKLCKVGKASLIPERDTQYATSEIIRGKFNNVYELPFKQLNMIDNLIKNEFKTINVRFNGGTEFYKKEIIALIEPYLKKLNITFKKLTNDDVNKLIRQNRIKQNFKKIRIKLLTSLLNYKKINNKILTSDLPQGLTSDLPQGLTSDLPKGLTSDLPQGLTSDLPQGLTSDLPQIQLNINTITKRTYQIEIIEKAKLHYLKNEKGILVIPCGVGKTLISLWIAQELKTESILIGVPNLLLLNQWSEIFNILFPNIPFLKISGNVNIDNICNFLKTNNKKCIVITTYSSSHKLFSAIKVNPFVFDIKILDEVHHLTTYNMEFAKTTKSYIHILNILSLKQLSLTATIKNLECLDKDCKDSNLIVSNDNINYFGEIIIQKCLLWAINENIICDYVIQTFITTDDVFNDLYETNNIGDNLIKNDITNSLTKSDNNLTKHNNDVTNGLTKKNIDLTKLNNDVANNLIKNNIDNDLTKLNNIDNDLTKLNNIDNDLTKLNNDVVKCID